jgi:hypothetical protein
VTQVVDGTRMPASAGQPSLAVLARLVDEPRRVEGILRNGWESVKVEFYRRKPGDDK